MTLPPAPPGPADDPRCVRCGYSLIGLDSRRPCPECGLLCRFSRLDGSELQNNHPRWLRRLRAGAALTAAGLLMLPLILLSCVLIMAWRFSRAGAPAPFGLSVSLWIGLAPAAVFLLGIWLLTFRSRRYALRREQLAMRLCLRTVAAVPALIPLVVLWATRRGTLPNWLADGWFALFGMLLVPLPWLLFAYLRRLADRAPAPLLAGDSSRLGPAFSMLLLLPLAMTALAETVKIENLGSTAFTVYTTILTALYAPFVIGMPLLWIWSIYLLIRYAIAFGKSARQARQLMADFDASRNPAAVVYDPPP